MKKCIVKVLLVSPRAIMPEQGRRAEDIGYDIGVHAIVEKTMDHYKPYARRVLWDFFGQPDRRLQHKLGHARINGKVLSAYMLEHGESILLGTGIALGMDNHTYAELRPRGSTAENEFLTMNGSLPKQNDLICFHNFVPWDPGFKGEGVVRVMNYGKSSFPITYGWRPSQLVFLHEGLRFSRPVLKRVHTVEELGKSIRLHCSHGSSGTHARIV